MASQPSLIERGISRLRTHGLELSDGAERQAVGGGVTRRAPGRSGPIEIRVFDPGSAKALYLHFHEGCWALGSASSQDARLWQLAQESRVIVLSVEYRLAPENPYPAAVEDAEDVALWLVNEGPDVFGTTRFMIGGESAGAHLAALTLTRLRDRHNVVGAFIGAHLVAGIYDLGLTPSQRNWGERPLILTTSALEWFYEMFVPRGSSRDRRDPEISPLFEDLSSLPPALFIVGTLDPLVDDTLMMEARWHSSAERTRLAVFPEAIHGFQNSPTRLAAIANGVSTAWVRDVASGRVLAS